MCGALLYCSEVPDVISQGGRPSPPSSSDLVSLMLDFGDQLLGLDKEGTEVAHMGGKAIFNAKRIVSLSLLPK